jgi:hypothetical protein
MDEHEDDRSLDSGVIGPRPLSLEENCSISEIYRRISKGEYEAYRDGRSCKITRRSVRARRERLLRDQRFTPRAVVKSATA